MKAVSVLLHFLNNHSILSLFIFILLGIYFSFISGKLVYAIVFSVIGFVNIFTAQFFNAMFLNAYGVTGKAIITQVEQTNSTLNDEYIDDYDAIVKTPDGKDVNIQFNTMSASIYPVRNNIRLPQAGEEIVVKYIPGVEKNIVIMSDESNYGKTIVTQETLKPVDKAWNQFKASPGNKDFKAQYSEALKQAISMMEQHNVDTQYVENYKRMLKKMEKDSLLIP